MGVWTPWRKDQHLNYPPSRVLFPTMVTDRQPSGLPTEPRPMPGFSHQDELDPVEAQPAGNAIILAGVCSSPTTTNSSTTTERTTTVSRIDVARGGAGVASPAVLGEWTRIGLAQQRLEPPTRSTGRVSVRSCISGVARKSSMSTNKSSAASCVQRRGRRNRARSGGTVCGSGTHHGDGTLPSPAHSARGLENKFYDASLPRGSERSWRAC